MSTKTHVLGRVTGGIVAVCGVRETPGWPVPRFVSEDKATCRRCLALIAPRPAPSVLDRFRPPVKHYRVTGTFTAPCGRQPMPDGIHWTTDPAQVTCPDCAAKIDTCSSCHRTADERPDPDPLADGVCGACREAAAEAEADREHQLHGQVYLVLTMDVAQGVPVVRDCEVLDRIPKWDWLALGQVVRVGNVNGGDSIAVEMPAENRGR